MKKIGKRVLALTVATVLTLSMGMSVLAAPSAGTTGVVSKVESATDEKGTSFEITIAEVSATDTKATEAVKEVKKEATVKEVLGTKFVEGMKVTDVRDVKANQPFSGSIKITFKVPGVVKTTKVAVLHFGGEKWEEVPSEAGNGTITATFTSLSPVAFVIDENTVDVSSPKDGELNLVPVVAVVALVAAAGAVVLRKKATR